MNNFDFYKNRILAGIEKSNYLNLAIDKETKELKTCDQLTCKNCLLRDESNCYVTNPFFEWLCEEHKEPEEFLTLEEHNFLSLFQEGYIIRDGLGNLFYSEDYPTINNRYEAWEAYNVVKLKKEYFPFITWESQKSWSIEKLKKLPVNIMGAKND